eukprot:10350338-Alexandrium_andersonii.AAC.1
MGSLEAVAWLSSFRDAHKFGGRGKHQSSHVNRNATTDSVRSALRTSGLVDRVGQTVLDAGAAVGAVKFRVAD